MGPDRSDFSKSVLSPIFMKFDADVQHLRGMSLLTFERSRSTLKVKCCTESLPLAVYSLAVL